MYITYPKKKNSLARHIMIDGEQISIIEDYNRWDEKLAAKAYERYEQVEILKEQLFKREYGDCRHCEHSHDYFNILGTHYEICQHPKSNLETYSL